MLLVEWTHSNSDYYSGVDIPIYLDSTPQETLQYRLERNRDQWIDNPFTMMVLDIEQKMLKIACMPVIIQLLIGRGCISWQT